MKLKWEPKNKVALFAPTKAGIVECAWGGTIDVNAEVGKALVDSHPNCFTVIEDKPQGGRASGTGGKDDPAGKGGKDDAKK